MVERLTVVYAYCVSVYSEINWSPVRFWSPGLSFATPPYLFIHAPNKPTRPPIASNSTTHNQNLQPSSPPRHTHHTHHTHHTRHTHHIHTRTSHPTHQHLPHIHYTDHGRIVASSFTRSSYHCHSTSEIALKFVISTRPICVSITFAHRSLTLPLGLRTVSCHLL